MTRDGCTRHTRNIMELTKHAHEELQSSRRVTEATYGPMGATSSGA